MFHLWTNWLEAVRFAAEAQSVVWLRLVVLASGGQTSRQEALRMISDKIIAFSDAEIAAADALVHGRGLLDAAECAYAPVRRRVHANSRRLLHTLH